MTERGLLIAFEGGDGSGKSTQAGLLAKRIDAVLTRQAGGTPLGQKIRELLLHPESADVAERAAALLFMADRAEHVEKLVVPALRDGKNVVSDRWSYSTLVYQGYGRGLDVSELRHIADWATKGVWPDAVVMLDVPFALGEERRDGRGEKDHYELAGNELQQRVVEGYRELADADPHRWRVVDGTGSVDEVAERVFRAIEPLLSRATVES